MPITAQPAAADAPPQPQSAQARLPVGQPISASGRRLARAAVMQSLYESDAVAHDAADALGIRMSEIADMSEWDEKDAKFARATVAGVFANADEIDGVIAGFAPNWPISQMAVVDRNILRMAIYEIMFSRSTPPKVAVNEAVVLAKAFGGESAPRFVNGVLGSVMAAAAADGGGGLGGDGAEAGEDDAKATPASAKPAEPKPAPPPRLSQSDWASCGSVGFGAGNGHLEPASSGTGQGNDHRRHTRA